MSQHFDDRLSELKQEVRARLEHCCAGWPSHLFDGLVDSIANVTYKYEQMMTGLSFERHSNGQGPTPA